ncbi:CRISPR-associated RAMP protein Csx7 [Defluviitalea raffinosedens]|jgi:CRISPR-associated RAMP protein (TIGR02581 family)|uniref:type III CRISPR-associated RAMP protein Csx7 n=1 Tax=Defluviitalea raffinosedens TaxID=1450156 RepID=UPI001763B5C1|nr:CRISPR-associated RAMP protein Csx7 [Defluviitalea raffinosedens]MBM7685895.1 CRISPR-associated RAMP protein (TIGR02581 family) [Defluviitalea raffinosedens]HHW68113.1 CRISPR-associated RAMP protein [Candidatus Epulonipiscium sp.]
MFKKLYNEAKITYILKTLSPLYIKSGKNDSLNPTGVDDSFLRVYKDGDLVPVLPGTSIKGVFRSRAEKILKGSCDLFNSKKNCASKVNKKKDDGTARYDKSCPACKLFGSTVLKSRVLFGDAYPEGEYKVGSRQTVAIDRITGASKKSALFDLEYVEDALFKGEIEIQNFFRWHIKVLTQLFEEVNDGFVVFGGLTSKGFGRMKLDDFQIKLKYYDKSKCGKDYVDKGFYMEKTINSFEELQNTIKNISLTADEIGRCEYNEQAL